MEGLTPSEDPNAHLRDLVATLEDPKPVKKAEVSTASSNTGDNATMLFGEINALGNSGGGLAFLRSQKKQSMATDVVTPGDIREAKEYIIQKYTRLKSMLQTSIRPKGLVRVVELKTRGPLGLNIAEEIRDSADEQRYRLKIDQAEQTVLKIASTLKQEIDSLITRDIDPILENIEKKLRAEDNEESSIRLEGSDSLIIKRNKQVSSVSMPFSHKNLWPLFANIDKLVTAGVIAREDAEKLTAFKQYMEEHQQGLKNNLEDRRTLQELLKEIRALKNENIFGGTSVKPYDSVLESFVLASHSIPAPVLRPFDLTDLSVVSPIVDEARHLQENALRFIEQQQAAYDAILELVSPSAYLSKQLQQVKANYESIIPPSSELDLKIKIQNAIRTCGQLERTLKALDQVKLQEALQNQITLCEEAIQMAKATRKAKLETQKSALEKLHSYSEKRFIANFGSLPNLVAKLEFLAKGTKDETNVKKAKPSGGVSIGLGKRDNQDFLDLDHFIKAALDEGMLEKEQNEALQQAFEHFKDSTQELQKLAATLGMGLTEPKEKAMASGRQFFNTCIKVTLTQKLADLFMAANIHRYLTPIRSIDVTTGTASVIASELGQLNKNISLQSGVVGASRQEEVALLNNIRIALEEKLLEKMGSEKLARVNFPEIGELTFTKPDEKRTEPGTRLLGLHKVRTENMLGPDIPRVLTEQGLWSPTLEKALEELKQHAEQHQLLQTQLGSLESRKSSKAVDFIKELQIHDSSIDSDLLLALFLAKQKLGQAFETKIPEWIQSIKESVKGAVNDQLILKNLKQLLSSLFLQGNTPTTTSSPRATKPFDPKDYPEINVTFLYESFTTMKREYEQLGEDRHLEILTLMNQFFVSSSPVQYKGWESKLGLSGSLDLLATIKVAAFNIGLILSDEVGEAIGSFNVKMGELPIVDLAKRTVLTIDQSLMESALREVQHEVDKKMASILLSKDPRKQWEQKASCWLNYLESKATAVYVARKSKQKLSVDTPSPSTIPPTKPSQPKPQSTLEKLKSAEEQIKQQKLEEENLKKQLEEAQQNITILQSGEELRRATAEKDLLQKEKESVESALQTAKLEKTLAQQDKVRVEQGLQTANKALEKTQKDLEKQKQILAALQVKLAGILTYTNDDPRKIGAYVVLKQGVDLLLVQDLMPKILGTKRFDTFLLDLDQPDKGKLLLGNLYLKEFLDTLCLVHQVSPLRKQTWDEIFRDNSRKINCAKIFLAWNVLRKLEEGESNKLNQILRKIYDDEYGVLINPLQAHAHRLLMGEEDDGDLGEE